MPQVSFIVPAFNEQEHLPNCLASIRAQRGEFEIIVVNNNSRDETADIARRYADRVIFCGVQGIAAARNSGAARAESQLLAFVDADATLHRDWLSRGLEHLSTRKLDGVCGMNYFLEDSLPRFCFYNSYSLGFLLFTAVRSVAGRPVVAGNNLIIRKQSLLAAGGFPRFVGEDIKLSSALNRAGFRTSFCRSMRIGYSPRRFRQRGFFRVLFLWISTLARDLPEGSYAIDYASRAGSDRVTAPE